LAFPSIEGRIPLQKEKVLLVQDGPEEEMNQSGVWMVASIHLLRAAAVWETRTELTSRLPLPTFKEDCDARTRLPERGRLFNLRLRCGRHQDNEVSAPPVKNPKASQRSKSGCQLPTMNIDEAQQTIKGALGGREKSSEQFGIGPSISHTTRIDQTVNSLLSVQFSRRSPGQG
jgi:hypothetical protein